nr:MAG TPA: hypothetical protein [Inoviridae sp.]
MINFYSSRNYNIIFYIINNVWSLQKICFS